MHGMTSVSDHGQDRGLRGDRLVRATLGEFGKDFCFEREVIFRFVEVGISMCCDIKMNSNVIIDIDINVNIYIYIYMKLI